MEHKALTAEDRCDRCNAQAYIRTVHDAGPLLWCHHHFNDHKDVLIASMVTYVPLDNKQKEPART